MNDGILFVGHEASRSGAPMAQLHFLRWYKLHGKRRFRLLLGCGGPLVSDFEAVADTWALERSRWCPGGLRASSLRVVGLGKWAERAELRDLRKFANGFQPGLVYVNSIGSARPVGMLRPQCPVLTHIHELDTTGFLLFGHASPWLDRLMRRTDHFIACSQAVRRTLVVGQHIAPERVDVVYESIPVKDVRAKRSRDEIFAELNVPANASLVIGCGTASWRKGADIFVQLARAVARERGPAYFVWVGGTLAVWEKFQFDHDVRLADLSDRVRFTGEVANPADYVAAADVFALTSREDPYPLVCLEAAALGKPIVCFADAGGIPEFVEEDCGYAVPYLDVSAMAQRVIELLDSPERRGAMGEAARRKVTERHDVSMAAPRIAEIIERTIAEANGR